MARSRKRSATPPRSKRENKKRRLIPAASDDEYVDTDGHASSRTDLAVAGKECPECHERFDSMSKLKVHSKVHGSKVVQCPEATCAGKSFADPAALRKHYNFQHNWDSRVRRKCNLSFCRANVSEYPWEQKGLNRHMRGHEKDGHLEGITVSPSTDIPEPLPFPEEFDLDGKYSSIIWDELMKVQKELLEPPCLSENEPNLGRLDRASRARRTLDQHERDQRLELLGWNEALIRQYQGQGARVNLDKVGRVCLGPLPESNERFITELCPSRSVLGLDTVRLFPKFRSGSIFHGQQLEMHPSCEACMVQKDFNHRLDPEERQLLKGPPGCFVEDCTNSRWQGGTHCYHHIGMESCNTGPDVPRLNYLRDRYAHILSHDLSEWKIPLSQRPLIEMKEAIEDGREPAVRLLALDLEFSWANGDKLAQVHEMCLYAYGQAKPIINARVVEKAISTTEKPVVQGGPEVLTLQQIASRLKSAGVTPNSMMIDYSINHIDWQSMFSILQSMGYQELWPKKENTFAIYSWIAANVPPGIPCPLSLVVVFNALFGEGHYLTRKAHRAKSDTEMLLVLFKRLSVLPLGNARYPPRIDQGKAIHRAHGRNSDSMPQSDAI